MSTPTLIKSTCGHEIKRRGGGAGYTATRDGRVLCYACADVEQLTEAQRAQHGDKIHAYLSSDGQTVTTWSGGMIGRVTRCGEGWVSPTARGVHVVAKILGGPWCYGRGSGRGMYIMLHPYKRQEWRS